MSLFLSVHALKRMSQRGITRDEIEQALESRETTYASAEDPTRMVVLGRTDAGRKLKVVVESFDQTAVITVAERGEEA